jgi:hypothetical protein
MTLTEPTLAPPTVDMAQIFAAHAERAARIEALRPGNKDRLFDGLLAAGITHVTVPFDGAGDSGQIESIGAWSGEIAVEFPATEIAYAALTWDGPAPVSFRSGAHVKRPSFRKPRVISSRELSVFGADCRSR